MRGPRFTGLVLSYGCHARRFELPEDPLPIVITGPNGSGKTTLLEAIPRALFGFRRRREEDRRILAARVPWSGAPLAATVELVTSDGQRLSLHRDFDTDRVEVRGLTADRVLFSGEANPVSDSHSALAYRAILSEVLGLDDGDTYRRTAWIGQGELLATDLDSGLLRAASGGEALIHQAVQAVGAAHEKLTAMPIVPGERRRRTKDRELESARREAQECAENLERARRAEEERLTLVRSRARVESELADLDRQLASLEAALGPLTESRALEAELEAERGRLRRLEEAGRDLREALGDLRRSEAESDGISPEALYPGDFEQRTGRLEVLWARREEIETELKRAREEQAGAGPARARPGLPAAGAAASALVAALLLASGSPFGWTLAGLGLVLAAWAWLLQRRESHRSTGAEHVERARASLQEIDDRLRAETSALPDGNTLSPETLPDRQFRFEAQRSLAQRLDRDRSRLASLATQAARTLAAAAVAPAGADGASDAAGQAEGLESAGADTRVESLLDLLESARLQSLERVAARALLSETSKVAVAELPDGVEASLAGVERARRDRRAAREELERELRQTLVRLAQAEEDRIELASLEESETALRARVERLEAEVRVHELAHALLQDGYADFRAGDQERLLSAISEQLSRLSGGTLGPVQAQESLAEVRVGRGGRPLALASPPLSFGEQHLALLAIRLGAADFLAEESVLHPLLVDEPLAHLDEDRARQTWEALCRVAETRQVILTTQDRLMLAHLGVRADLDLGT